MITAAEVQELNGRFQHESAEEILAWAWERFGSRAAIGTSFQGAGLVTLHLARQHRLEFPVFTIDTGLLFKETADLKQRLEDFFGCKIESLQPSLTVEQQAAVHGPELWQRDPDLCCTMRKVMPLQQKLFDLDCWITGLRREQSQARAGIGVIELYQFEVNTGRTIAKLNPMANWRREAVWQHIHQHNIPYHPLHDAGYRSIGCAPCTKKTAEVQNERAGRWTGFSKTECGIHTFMQRKA